MRVKYIYVLTLFLSPSSCAYLLYLEYAPIAVKEPDIRITLIAISLNN